MNIKYLLAFFAYLLFISCTNINKADSVQENIIPRDSVLISEQDTITLNLIGDQVLVKGKEISVIRLNSDYFVYGFILFALLILLVFLFIRKRKKTKIYNKQLVNKLSEREIALILLIQQGKANKEIATELFISLSTVKTHINNIYKKLDLKSRDEMRKFKI